MYKHPHVEAPDVAPRPWWDEHDFREKIISVPHHILEAVPQALAHDVGVLYGILVPHVAVPKFLVGVLRQNPNSPKFRKTHSKPTTHKTKTKKRTT